MTGADRAALDLARQLLSETREELARADGKASILFAAVTVVVAAVVTGIATGPWNPTRLTAGAQAIWWLGTVFVAAGVFCVGSAVYPRVGQTGESGRLTYFMHVLAYPAPNDLRRALEAEAEDPLGRSIDQLHALSRIVKNKYTNVDRALRFTGIGALLALAAVLIH